MRRPDLPTGTVTFLFTDIEGSTRLVGELDPLVYREILELHHRLLREAFERHGGVERGTQGDAFLVIFEVADAAIRAAVDAQRAITAASWPSGATVRVRMGLHAGHGIAGGDDYVGMDINRAARIATAAHGGQILVSDAVRGLAERSLPDGVALRDLGEHRLRDLSRPERLYQVVAAGLPSSFPPVRALEATTGVLPVRLTSFIGRQRELDELAAMLESDRLITLTGPGGSGKSSLAVELARSTQERYPDGAWFVPLEAVADLDLVAPAVATTLGLVEGGMPARERVLEHVAGRTLLLVLDNLEQVRDAGGFVGELLRQAPGVRIVATSRAPLGISAEQEYPVAPLPVPGPGEDPRASDCVRLFTERARRVRRDFEPSDADLAAIARICDRLDGLPLGVELAAGRVGLLPPATIADRLERELDLPGAGPRDLPERQRTMHATIGWSCDLLDEASRTLFARLSVFAGGARLEEIGAVCGAGPDTADDILGRVAVLVEHSLVRPTVGPDGPRFELLETIRRFAAERLAERPEVTEIQRGHADAYLRLVEASTAFVPGRHQVAWLARLAAEHDNLRAAMRSTIGTRDAERGLRFLAAMWRFWQLAGHLEEGVALATEILAIPGAEMPTALRLRALDAVGGLHYWRGEQVAAQQRYREQLDLARRLGDPRSIAEALFNLSFPTAITDDVVGAQAMAEEARAIYRELGDESRLARVEWSLASLAQFQGRSAAALPILERGLARFIADDDLPYAALAQGSIGWSYGNLGDMENAVRYGIRSLVAYHALGDVSTTALTLHGGAILLAVLGRIEEAATADGAADALSARYGVRPPAALEGVLFGSAAFVSASNAIHAPGNEDALARGARMTLDEAVDFLVRAADDWLATRGS